MGLVGEAVDLTYDYAHVGTDRAALEGLLDHKFGAVLDMPSLVIVGAGAINEADGEAVLAVSLGRRVVGGPSADSERG